MTNLRHLLAFNLKQNRRKLGFSQAKLAEKAGASTQYIAMVELEKKYPSPEMLERFALALGIDSLDLFIPLPSVANSLNDLKNAVLTDLEKALSLTLNKTLKQTVSEVIDSHLEK
jgi:transcriptional regulator with XRE-family HTH domain